MGTPIGLKLLALFIFTVYFNDLLLLTGVEAGCCGCCCGCCRCCCCPQPPIIIQPPPALHKVCHVPCCCCRPCCCCCKPCCCCCGCGGGRKKRSTTYRYELLRKRREISDFVQCRQSASNNIECNCASGRPPLNDDHAVTTTATQRTDGVLFPLATPFNTTTTTSLTTQFATIRARRLTKAPIALGRQNNKYICSC